MGSGTEADDRRDRLPARCRPYSPDDEAPDREHEEHLAELGRLELDDAEIEPALRSAHGLGGNVDDDHQRERRRVDELPGPAPDVDRDDGRDDEPDRSDRCCKALPDDEVVLVAGNVEARDAGDDPEAVADEAGGGSHEDPVEAAQERDQRRLGTTRGGSDPRAAGDLDHQSVSTTIASGASTLKKRSKTWSAAGAAALEPCPPFSMSAQTTRRAASDGPQPHHHD